MNPRRFFTVAEAEDCLPLIREQLEAMRESLAYLRRTSTPAPHGAEAPEESEEESPNAKMYAWALQRLEAAQRRLYEAGVEIRDVDRGLVDFPALHRNQIILLCWIDGEDRVEWFHGLDAGYSGRRPLAELEPKT